MSIKLMTAVFDRYPAGGGELLLALVLADFANDVGDGIWPSVATLSRKTRQSRRTVQGLLRRLEHIGFLACVRRSAGGKSNEWRIQLGFFDDCAKFARSAEPRKTERADRAKCDPKPRNSSAPKPPYPSSYPPPGNGGGELIYPLLAAEERTAIADMVACLPTTNAQQILDELAANIRRNAIRKTASALARELVRRAKAGTFRPELGLTIAAERAAKAEAEKHKAAEATRRNTGRNPAKAAKSLAEARSIIGMRGTS